MDGGLSMAGLCNRMGMRRSFFSKMIKLCSGVSSTYLFAYGVGRDHKRLSEPVSQKLFQSNHSLKCSTFKKALMLGNIF